MPSATDPPGSAAEATADKEAPSQSKKINSKTNRMALISSLLNQETEALAAKPPVAEEHSSAQAGMEAMQGIFLIIHNSLISGTVVSMLSIWCQVMEALEGISTVMETAKLVSAGMEETQGTLGRLLNRKTWRSGTGRPFFKNLMIHTFYKCYLFIFIKFDYSCLFVCFSVRILT